MKIDAAKATAQTFQLPTDGRLFVITGQVASLRRAFFGENIFDDAVEPVSDAAVRLMKAYSGETVERVSFRIDGFHIIGTLNDVFFEDRDKVEVVVTGIDEGTLLVHAVIRMKDGWLWLPEGVNCGSRPITKRRVKSALTFLLFEGILIAISCFFFDDFAPFLDVAPAMAGSILIVWAFYIFLVCQMSDGRHWYAESIFEILGFEEPSLVDLVPFALSGKNMQADFPYTSDKVYSLRDALSAYGSLA